MQLYIWGQRKNHEKKQRFQIIKIIYFLTFPSTSHSIPFSISLYGNESERSSSSKNYQEIEFHQAFENYHQIEQYLVPYLINPSATKNNYLKSYLIRYLLPISD